MPNPLDAVKGASAHSCELSHQLSTSALKNHDPDWAPSPRPQKKIKRTYSSKAGMQADKQTTRRESNERIHSLPSEMLLQFSIMDDHVRLKPILGEKRGPCPSAVYKDAGDVSRWGAKRSRQTHSNHLQQAPLREPFRQLAKSVSPAHWMLVNGLYTGLDALLKATSQSRPGERRGARSLFSMCLRNVPEYIAEEQLWCENDDRDANADVSSTIYAELETFGSTHAGGWKPLREVVRADGVALLGNAILEGLISPSVARGLVILCLQVYAYDEAEYIIDRMITVARPLSKPIALSSKLFGSDISISLSTLDEFASRSGRLGFQYRQLSSMFRSGKLPIEWISSRDMVDCWNGVIRSISQKDDHVKEATLLLQVVVSQGYCRTNTSVASKIHDLRLQLRTVAYSSRLTPTRSSQWRFPNIEMQLDALGKTSVTTISSLLTVLSSIGLLCSWNLAPEPRYSRVSSIMMLHNLAVEAHQAFELARYELSHNHAHSMRQEHLSISLFAAYLVGVVSTELECTQGQHINAFMDNIAVLNRNDGIHNPLGSFLCAVAHCCERATSHEAFKYLQDLIQQMTMSDHSGGELTTRKLRWRIAVAAANQFSDGTSRMAHLDWALDLEKSASEVNVDMACQSPSMTEEIEYNKSRIGYQWEEGICEWVERTPAVNIENAEPSEYQDQLSDEFDNDNESALESLSPPIRALSCLSEVSPCVKNRKNGTRALCQEKDAVKCTQVKSSRLNLKRLHNLARYRNDHGRHDQVYRSGIVQPVFVDEDTDELSTPESLQEKLSIGRPQLREVTNHGSNMKCRRVGEQGLEKKAKRVVQMMRLSGLKLCQSQDESEDELCL
ncbi:hypothetical protein MMC12_007666 [Toensbergia leucococca]|nr:hypothetical protein [Toensbergia leucococca]